jgi:hypothetical protein
MMIVLIKLVLLGSMWMEASGFPLPSREREL